MTDIIQLALAIVAGSLLVFGTIAIWILMGFYSVKILRSFKGGALSKGWKYVCIAVPFLVFGQLISGIGGSSSVTLLQEGTVIKVIGDCLSAIGGLLMVIGFRAEFKAWNPKGLQTKVPATA